MQPTVDRDVAVITPWYPTRQSPFRGSFVQAMVDATAPTVDRMRVYHCDDWVAQLSAREDAEVDAAARWLLPRAVHWRPTVGGAQLQLLPVSIPRGTLYAENARRHEAALRIALGGRPLDAPVVHAHVGLPSGWAGLRNMRPDAKLFVTEHASFLDLILADPDSRAMYDELLTRCTGFFAVGDGVRGLLSETFPQHRDRIQVMPNPISFEAARTDPVARLHRWIYVGGLKPTKGVHLLLEAFATCHADDDALTLTLVGEGPLLDQLKTRAGQLGVAHAVTFTGPVPPEVALRLMREHDLLVHPSRAETFGMVVVEASAAGLPVLVTRCGGPERTLSGIEEAAGQLFGVEDDAESIVEAYRRLAARWPDGLDLARARTELAARYGYQAVADAHHRAWFAGVAA
ncbi:glycosyltransferase [Catellatospora citrea]|uniref:Glycogen(Starch) synthase n=1 Tax=Catellatospora citrea TaxID=53366 RepID=A0A8J3KHT4_9ACTN|nr:glycosyltransferase [Catellatospora citrea]RKE09263.1 glycogen(starch) synthase [Catellatospora citrea]GIF97218.1 hypothetical protein Cci01nite_23120 [Catellatospora citrea]